MISAKLHACGFSLHSLKLVQSRLSDRIQKVEINSFFSHHGNVESGVLQVSTSVPVFLIFSFCDLFFVNIDTDIDINTDENVKIKIKNETITNSSNQKLLGILFLTKFGLDEYITLLGRKASQNLNVLAKVTHFMNLAQRRLIMHVSFQSLDIAHRYGCFMVKD